MKKLLPLLLITCVFASCYTLYPPTVSVNPTISQYRYVYIIPTSAVTSGTSYTGTGYYTGVYGAGITKSINPADVIAGDLMQRGYAILPNLQEDKLEKTVSVYEDDLDKTVSVYAEELTQKGNYESDEEQWNAIVISSGNENLLNAEVYYNHTTKTKITTFTVDNVGKISLTAINVPDDAVDTYKAATGFSTVANKIYPLSDIE